MTLTLVDYSFNPIAFFLFHGLMLSIATLVFVMIVFGEDDGCGNIKVFIRWTPRTVMYYIFYVIILFDGLFVGGITRLLSCTSETFTKAEEIRTIDFDGKYYTCNDSVLVKRDKVYYSTETEDSYVVEKRNLVCWSVGCNKYVTSYAIVFNESDYNKFYSDDIKNCETNGFGIAQFVYRKYGINTEDDNSNKKNKTSKETEDVKNIEAENENETGKEKEKENGEAAVSEELSNSLKEINNSLKNVQDSIEGLNKNVNEQKTELENQKKEIESLKNKKEVEKVDSNTLLVIIIGIAVIWIMILITIVTFIKIKTHSKKELILTASDAKIREGVMLDDDK